MARVFTPDYVEHVTLTDGTRVLLRLIAPEDKALLRRGFERWSPQSRYMRFLSPKQQLSDDELRYLCEIDHESHFALGAILESGDGTGEPFGAGIARFIRLPERSDDIAAPVTAEAAIAVADEVSRKGLGRALFVRLCAAAAERGIERIRCEVLASNQAMRDLVAAVATDHMVVVDGELMTIEFALAPVDDALSVETGSSATYRFFRAAAEEVVEWTDAIRRLWRR